ncbi:hypothetical protein A11S_2237 [Micavibrio aeruginosavorus EPB]|uniref:Uncharacterized protein n=1 Tax=Micavibrio aeruginosavorus EPB TaxID=349215 RepID=M4VIM0_9BACT|nr:hypothetical protein A11S_2237 [Micavibrio aeruginosavorus EPB]
MSGRLSCFPVYFQMVSTAMRHAGGVRNLRRIDFYSNPHQIYNNALI